MEEKKWMYEQGSVGFAMDTLVFELGMPQPDHIKIDVDGFEDKVLKGMERVLDKAKSVLVEMDSANTQHMDWKEALENRGFVVDPAQVAKARRTEGAFAGIGNIIFKRPQCFEEVTAESFNEAETDGIADSVQT